jgi:hypothetical protein
MDALVVHIEGIGWWSPGIADWNSAADFLRGDATPPTDGDARPGAAILPPNERRRAPEPVVLACEVAMQACAMADRAPAELPCVFASVHGDLVITDALCATLAADPLELSPTRFHNSVHNAAAGYWTVAAHCHAASSAVSASHGSFAAGLLEAAIQAHAEQTPVLFAAYDNSVRGPLADVVHGSAPFGVAFVVSPQSSPRAHATLHLRHVVDTGAPTAVPTLWTALAATNPIAPSLPLFIALARQDAVSIRLRNGASSMLEIEVRA